MFDWNDEELADIIWGEAGENDDHIVPYPDKSEEKPPGSYGDHNKEWDKEAANVKPAEQKTVVATTDSHGGKVGNNSQCDTWPDLSLSNAAKTDQDHKDEKAQLDSGSGIFENQPEHREESDFVDYGWVNIGSFDDLDRILSNDDPMFGHVNLGNADELWSPSKDLTNGPEKSVSLSLDSSSLGLGALRSKSEHFETKAECMIDQDQPTPGFLKMNNFSSHSPQRVKAGMDSLEYGGGRSKPILKDKAASDMAGRTSTLNYPIDGGKVVSPTESNVDKVSRHKRPLKGQKRTGEKSEARKLQTFCAPWSSFGDRFEQFDGQYAPQMGPPSSSPVITQQQQFFTNLLSPSVYVTTGNQYPAMPALPQFHSGEGNHLQVPSGYEVSAGNSNPLNKFPDAPTKALNMTPQEKIKKLRRRQQMRAMLAIRKQQQQFNHQVPCNEYSVSPRCSHENQTQLMEGGNIEVDETLSTLLSLDLNSTIEQNDSNTVSMCIDNNSMEDLILNQLQDVIAKLDIQIRLCIRDSLFRLAQSSMERQNAVDTSSTNKRSRDELKVLMENGINSHKRFARMPDVETETNPIDRTVAHLLFHRPELPLSTNLPCERKVTSLMSFPMGVFIDDHKDNPSTIFSCLFAEGNESKNTCVDTSENASNNETVDSGAMEVEASQ